MFKTYFSLLLLFFCSFGFLTAQSIIQSAILTTGIVTLGGTSQVQINLEQITICDTEMTTVEIDHTAKIIKVNINYNFISSCTASFSIIPINKAIQPLLEGSYTVNLTLTVPSDGSKNEFRTLGSLFVNRYSGTPCSPAVWFSGSCPSVGGSVCGEDGQTYINECEAVFKNRNANYEFGTCGVQAGQSVQTLECNRTYTQSGKNFFSKYSCFANSCFPGNELIFNYSHSGGNLELNYEKSASTEVILAKVGSFSSIECIEIGDEKLLQINNLPPGDYLVFVDGNTNFNIEFCTTTSISEGEIKPLEIEVFPNPASSEIRVNAPDFNNAEFEIYDLSGIIFKEGNLSNEQAIDLANFISGTYFLRLKNSDKTVVRKFVLQ